jgi:hypothetical protein
MSIRVGAYDAMAIFCREPSPEGTVPGTADQVPQPTEGGWPYPIRSHTFPSPPTTPTYTVLLSVATIAGDAAALNPGAGFPIDDQELNTLLRPQL